MFSSEKTGIQTIQIVHFEQFSLLEVWKTPKDWAILHFQIRTIW